METDQNIERWDTSNAQYQDTLAKLKERNERAMLSDLLSLANERAFYCSLKRKYCGKYLSSLVCKKKRSRLCQFVYIFTLSYFFFGE